MALALPLKAGSGARIVDYTINLDIANFAAEHMVMGQKVEAAMLQGECQQPRPLDQGRRQDQRRSGRARLPQAAGDAEAEVRIQATLDENARSKLGFDLSGFLTGPMPIKLSGRVPAHEGDSRFAIEADLTQAKIDNLLPGWSKAAGPGRRARPSRW